MKKAMITSLASVAILATATFAVAQQDDSSRWIQQRVAKRIVSRIESRLNMTATQREQAKAILKTEEPTVLALAQQAKQEREELGQMPSFNEEQTRAIAQKYAATDADILVERTKLRLELRAILDDTQRKQLDAMRAHAGEHRAERLDSFIDAI